jgi:hypothetical protein
MAEEKRIRIPLWVKLEAALIALGLDPDAVDWHHEPPLKMRPWTGEDYDPPQLDPRHIVPMPRVNHRQRTATADIPAIAKTRRVTKAELEFRERLLARMNGEPRTPGKWPSRPFRSKL